MRAGANCCCKRENKINLTRTKTSIWGWPLLLALCGFTFFLGLGGLPLVGPDEPRYAEIGREMWASGDWITPRLAGYLWFEKPVWLYWGEAISYHLFGVNEFAARFPSALSALLTVVFVAFVAGKLVSRALGLVVGRRVGDQRIVAGIGARRLDRYGFVVLDRRGCVGGPSRDTFSEQIARSVTGCCSPLRWASRCSPKVSSAYY